MVNENFNEKKSFINQLKLINKNEFIICDEWLSSDYNGNFFRECPWQEKIQRLSHFKKI